MGSKLTALRACVRPLRPVWLSVITVFLVVEASAARTERQYTVSKDANDEVLSMQEFGVPDLTHRFTIYGDGRLVGRDLGVHGNATVPENSVQVWLSSDEAKAILDTLVGSGLVDFEGDVGKRRREIINGKRQEGEPETITVSGDTAGISLRISLASYQSPQRNEVRPSVHVVHIFNPEYLAKQYRGRGVAGQIPESEPQTFVEAEALSSVYEWLERLVYRKEAR